MIVAYSNAQRTHKLPGGRIEKSDTFTSAGKFRGREGAIIAGATRELFRETGIVGNKEMLFEETGVGNSDIVIPTELLPIDQPVRGGSQKRHFCFSILSSKHVLGRFAVENDEMMPAEFWKIREVLSRALRSEFNPYHGLAVCKWIILFTKIGVAEKIPECRAFENLLLQLGRAQIDCADVATEIQERLRNHSI
jgi:hypothetical protein